MSDQNNKKYLFIDTNIYRGLFTNTDYEGKIFKILEKLTKNDYKILMPQQVLDEINRNRFSTWSNENTKGITELEKLKKSLGDDIFNDLGGCKKLITQIDSKIKKIKKENSLLQKKLFSSKGGSGKLLSKLTGIVSIISDSPIVLSRVQLRTAKGNPPFDKNTAEKRCDGYIWESLLGYFPDNSIKKPTLYFFTRNYSDWCVSYGDNKIINQFLVEEFKQKTGGKLKWSDDLKDLPDIDLSDKKIVQESEQKLVEDERLEIIERKFPEKLRESNTWDNSDLLMRLVTDYIPKFSKNLIQEIIKASLENNKVSLGPYNQVLDASEAVNFFTLLYTKSKEVGVPGKVWKDFYLNLNEDQQKNFYFIRKDLQAIGLLFKLDELKYLDITDIPF